ncbi:MAG: RHS repeat-associated core domain-containing protein [Thiobacillaceae bacterium]
MQLLARGFVRSLIYNIPLVIIMGFLSWLLHTILLIGPNGGFDATGNVFLDNVLVLRGRFISGTMFWTLLSSLFSILIGRLRQNGLTKTVQEFASTPKWVRDSLWGAGWPALAVAFGAALVASLISAIPRNPLVSLQLAILSLSALSEQGRSLPALVVRLGWSDAQRLLNSGKPVRPLAMGWAGAFVTGGAIGCLAMFLGSIIWCLGFPAFFLGLVLLAVIIAMRGNRPALATLALALLLGGALAFAARTVHADDGGWAEAGGNFWDWIRSEGAAIAVAMGLPASAGAAIGALLGSLLGGLPVPPAVTTAGAGGLGSTFGSWPGLKGGPGDNPFTKFSGGDGPGECSPQGLPNYWVNTATLDLVIRDTILRYQGLGPEIALTMTYVAAPEHRSMLGKGWAFAYGSSIREEEDSLLLLKGSGQVLRFRRGGAPQANAPGEAVNLSGSRDRLLDYGSYWLYIERTSRLRYRYEKVTGGARLTAISDPAGNAVQLAYGADGTLQTITDAAGRVTRLACDGERRCVSLTAPDGRQASLAYDPQGYLAQVVDLAGIPTLYQYDAAGYIARMVVGHDHKATTFTYKPGTAGQVAAVTNAEGRTTRYDVIAEGPRQVRVTDPAGNATVYVSNEGRTERVIDALGGQTIIVYASGLPISVQDRTGSVTRMEYDPQGNMVRRIDPAGQATTWTYDAQGNVLTVTDALGHTRAYEYDARGNLVKETWPSGKAFLREYDARGQLIARIDGAGARTAFTRDAFGNVTAVTDPLGNTTRITWDPYGLTRLARTDPNGHTTRYEYDRNGRLTKEMHPDGSTTEHAYDCCAQIRSVDENGHAVEVRRAATLELEQWTDAAGNTWRWEYDAAGRQRCVTDPLGHASAWQYDAAGRVIEATDALGRAVRFAYDAEGRLMAFTDERGQTTRLGYDASGQPVRATDPQGRVVTIERDALGRLQAFNNARGGRVSTVYDSDGHIAATYEGQTLVASFAYDAADNLVRVSDPTGATAYVYDAAGRTVAIRYPSGQRAEFAYDEAGNLQSVTYPGGLQVSYRYDARNRPTWVAWGAHRLTCRYDAGGNLVAEERSNGTQSTFTYDARDLLVGYRHLRGEQVLAERALVRDAVGNITAEEGLLPVEPELDLSPISGSVNAAGELVSWGGETLAYDADGNLTAMGSGLQAMYDAQNRLTRLTRGGDARTYTYNGLDQRVRVETPAGARLYHHDPLGRLLFETDETGQLIASYVYRGPFLVARVSASGEVLFYHADQRGSTLALTGADGDIAAAYAYNPWGAVVGRNGAVENPFTFVGTCGVTDEGDGLFFMANRYYHARLGRFIQRDPIGLAGGWNTYAYAGNNPVGRIDPQGYLGLDLGDWKFWVGSSLTGLGGILVLAPTGVSQAVGLPLMKIGTGMMITGGGLAVYSTATAMPDALVQRAHGTVDAVNKWMLTRDEKTGKWVVDPIAKDNYDEANYRKLLNSAENLNRAEEEAARLKKKCFPIFGWRK